MKKFLFLLGLLAFFGAKAMEKNPDENGSEQNKEDSAQKRHFGCRCEIVLTEHGKRFELVRPACVKNEQLEDAMYDCHVKEGFYCDAKGIMYTMPSDDINIFGAPNIFLFVNEEDIPTE